LYTLQLIKANIAHLVVVSWNTSVAVRDARVAATKLDQALHNRAVYLCRPSNDGGSVPVESNLCQHSRADPPQIAKIDVIDTENPHNTSNVIGIDTSASQCLQKTL
jgi:hypothetical protein